MSNAATHNTATNTTDGDGDDIQMSAPSTPLAQRTFPTDLSSLSPPDSQGGGSRQPQHANTSMPTVATNASGANANGKRPLSSLADAAAAAAASSASATATDASSFPAGVNSGMGGLSMDGNSGAAAAQQDARQVRTHQPSGYTYSRIEDAPGYAWSNKKAVEEYNRALEHVVAKDRAVGKRYGDIVDMCEREERKLAQPV